MLFFLLCIAVLVGNSSLFIIFGSTSTSDSALGVLDIDNYTWLNTVPALAVNDAESGNQDGSTPGTGDDNDGSNSSGSSSTGAIAGGVVGSVAGVSY